MAVASLLDAGADEKVLLEVLKQFLHMDLI